MKTSKSSSEHASPLCNIQSFDDWIDYLSSKATPTSQPLMTHSHSPVGLSDHDSISNIHKPPSLLSSHMALSYNEILDRYFPSVPDDDNGNNDEGGKVHSSLFTMWYLIHATAQHPNLSQPSESRVLKWKHGNDDPQDSEDTHKPPWFSPTAMYNPFYWISLQFSHLSKGQEADL